jgi:single-strand DNA-binding protein
MYVAKPLKGMNNAVKALTRSARMFSVRLQPSIPRTLCTGTRGTLIMKETNRIGNNNTSYTHQCLFWTAHRGATRLSERFPPARSYSSAGQPIAMEEIDFNPMAANSLNIIGNVGRKPEIKYLESGSKVTNFPIAFSDRKDGDTQWFDVEAWDELAELACANIEKGERVALQGRLKVQDWTDREGNTRKNLRIVAQNIQRVRRNSMLGGQPMYQEDGMQNDMNTQAVRQTASNARQSSNYEPQQQRYSQQDNPMTNEELWMSFFENTSGWYDNREKKQNGEINPKSPDFKRIEGGREAPALWIDSKTTPAWVKSELSKLDRLQDDIPPF